MVSNRILIPVAWFCPVQCLGLAIVFRSLASSIGLSLPVAGAIGLVVGVALVVPEIAILTMLFDRKRTKRKE